MAVRPYVIWMLLFTLIPLGVVFYFAFTDLNGSFTLHNLSAIGSLSTWLDFLHNFNQILKVVVQTDIPGIHDYKLAI